MKKHYSAGSSTIVVRTVVDGTQLWESLSPQVNYISAYEIIKLETDINL